ncbi:hypothetical protein OEZ86_000145 [Tetradesmus obliquus]|nr:hypothetical protein OEZ86_000145 [Tetradesmus obliquus]
MAQQPLQKQSSRLRLLHGQQNFLTINFSQLHHDSWEQAREAPQYIKQVLSQGVIINGEHYYFVGSSAGQLRERVAVLYRCSSPEQAWQLLLSWGDFGSIGSAAKMYKRIGLMFSGVSPISLDTTERSNSSSSNSGSSGGQPTINAVEVGDIEAGGSTFTDGCGIISQHCARRVMASRGKITLHDKTYLPSVYQIRYKGYKGVVHIDTPDGAYMAAAATAAGMDLATVADCDLLLRKSMRKVGGVSDATLGLVAVSLPYKVGFLNQQFVLLLSALGVPDDVLLQQQAEYFRELEGLCSDASVATRYLLMDEKYKEAEAVACLPDDSSLPPAVMSHMQRIYSREARSPSYFPGDLRVLQLLDVPQLRQLQDVLVLPVQGPRPHADECSGGDYDGDQFFICWDERLVPSKHQLQQPLDYSADADPAAPAAAAVDHGALIEYFAQYDPFILGRLNS